MIERIRTKRAQNVRKFYYRIYKNGGYFSEENFNRRALNVLGIKKRENTRLLDIACGQGTLLSLAEKYVKTFGVDISAEAIKKAKRNAPKSVLKVSAAEKMPFSKEHFDYVTCMGSLEHFFNVDRALKEMRRVMKKDGKAVIHVQNSQYLIHKILGINSQGQINERLATEGEWRNIIEKHFFISEVYKYNTRFYFQWIPKKYCCHFTFLCIKNQE